MIFTTAVASKISWFSLSTRISDDIEGIWEIFCASGSWDRKLCMEIAMRLSTILSVICIEKIDRY